MGVTGSIGGTVVDIPDPAGLKVEVGADVGSGVRVGVAVGTGVILTGIRGFLCPGPTLGGTGFDGVTGANGDAGAAGAAGDRGDVLVGSPVGVGWDEGCDTVGLAVGCVVGDSVIMGTGSTPYKKTVPETPFLKVAIATFSLIESTTIFCPKCSKLDPEE